VTLGQPTELLPGLLVLVLEQEALSRLVERRGRGDGAGPAGEEGAAGKEEDDGGEDECPSPD
jgi:hypothetical protein